MKSLAAALVPNRTARFSHVIVHGSKIYSLFTQTHTYKRQTGVQFHNTCFCAGWYETHTHYATTQPSHSCIYCKITAVYWCKLV